MNRNLDHEIYALAERQSGYVVRKQALAIGLTPSMIRTRLHNGQWVVDQPGVYLLAGHRPTTRGHLAVACAVLGGVVSHESAAELYGAPGVERDLVVVTVAARRTHRFPGAVVHQSTDLTPHCVVDIEGLTTTAPARTILDLAAVLRRRPLRRVIDHFVSTGLASIDDVSHHFDRVARRGKRGFTALRDILGEMNPDYVPTESELEFRLAECLRDWGLPAPSRQVALPWRSSREGRVDFAYEDHRIILEADGRRWHTTVEAFDNDRMRDNQAQLAGWSVIRVTWRMLERQPLVVRELISEALKQRQRA